MEDAAAGVEAALAAGMWVLGSGPVGRVGAAHSVRENLAEVCLTDLLSQLQHAPVLASTH